MSENKVSIIIPTYNRAPLLGQTLESVIAQSYLNWECIVVDDGSTDYTEELMEHYVAKDNRIRFCIRKNLPKGASQCRNIGLNNATGEFVIFLDSDDLLLDFCLEARIDKTLTFSDMAFWVFPMLIEKKFGSLSTFPIPKKETYIEDFLSYRIHWGIMCTLWRTELVKKIGGFNPLYPRLNDPEIHIRAMLEASSSYMVFTDAKADSIFRSMVEIKERYEFTSRYFQSLILFIPDISSELIKRRKSNHLPLLKNYLKDFIHHFSKFNKRKDNLFLFRIAYKSQVFNIFQYCSFCFLYNFHVVFHKLSKKMKSLLLNFLQE